MEDRRDTWSISALSAFQCCRPTLTECLLCFSSSHRRRLDERAAKAAETRHRNKMCVWPVDFDTSYRMLTHRSPCASYREKLEGEIVRLKTELMETGEELNKAFVFSEGSEAEPISSPV
jgi:hypothetical protein